MVPTNSGDYLWNMVGGPAGAVNTGTGFMRCKPIYIKESTTFTEIATYVNSGGTAGAVVRLGIYEANADGMPAALLLDAGTVGTTTSGLKTIAISETLAAGKYFLTAVGQTAQCQLVAEVSTHTYVYDTINQFHGNTWELTGITGALPDPWTNYTTQRSESFRVLLKK